MTSFNSRFTSSIVLLAALSAALASPAFARGAAGGGGAGGGAGGGGSGGGGTVHVEDRVAPLRGPNDVISPLFQARYSGCQYDATGRLAWSPTGQPCPDTGY
jgi:hypothetical protein